MSNFAGNRKSNFVPQERALRHQRAATIECE